ncbi:HNH endonuclease [Streptomyces capillispiralis]|uniref:HNH endonuclease n=1 Tax=Streptomyces capillispiralis TaxID=68182 RepID=UPI0036B8F7C6
MAREEWTRAKAAKNHVREALESMTRGAVRCMYCDDNRGTDIDHFQPLENAPLRAFEWPNHLLACSWCNSNAKRSLYPVDADGVCLLVDPSAEDPAGHLRLLLKSGLYEPVAKSVKGSETIRVFGLNRSELVKGRMDAFYRSRSMLRDWHLRCQDADPDANRVAQALLDSPFIDVVYAMIRLKPAVAGVVVGPETVPALEAWRAEHSL